MLRCVVILCVCVQCWCYAACVYGIWLNVFMCRFICSLQLLLLLLLFTFSALHRFYSVCVCVCVCVCYTGLLAHRSVCAFPQPHCFHTNTPLPPSHRCCLDRVCVWCVCGVCGVCVRSEERRVG